MATTTKRHPDGSPDLEAVHLGPAVPLVPDQLDPRSSAARIAAQVHDDREDAAKDREAVVDQLQAQRKEREKARRRTRGLSSAEILAGTVRR
jgi:hypothetical protein